MRRILVWGRVLASALMVVALASCDWFYGTEDLQEEPRSSRRVWTELEADADWYERWSGWAAANGYGSRPAVAGARMAAVKLDRDSAPEWLTPRQGQDYGACSVFDLVVPEGPTWVDRNGDRQVMSAQSTFHVLDCVGSAAVGSAAEGLYRVAPLCSHRHGAMILRAGDQEHATGTVLNAWYSIGGSGLVSVRDAEWLEAAVSNDETFHVKCALADGFEYRCHHADCGTDHDDDDRFAARLAADQGMLLFVLGSGHGWRG